MLNGITWGLGPKSIFEPKISIWGCSWHLVETLQSALDLRTYKQVKLTSRVFISFREGEGEEGRRGRGRRAAAAGGGRGLLEMIPKDYPPFYLLLLIYLRSKHFICKLFLFTRNQPWCYVRTWSWTQGVFTPILLFNGFYEWSTCTRA